MRSLLAPLVAALAAVLSLPGAAFAHGGLLLGSAEAGAYRIQLMASAVTRSTDGPAIDYTAYVQRVDDGRPVEDATVAIVAELPDGEQRLRVQRIGNGYEGIARVPSARDVQAYPVRVSVQGPEGRTDLRVTPPDDDGPPVALLAGTVAVLLVLLGFAARARRRAPATASADESSEAG